MTPIEIEEELVRDVGKMKFARPVAYVYNPLVYAWRPHKLYIERYGTGRREVLFLGMNPGPWGMAQTGIPFGEVHIARDWLKVEAPVDKPAREHPKRRVEGFRSRRSEVSGARLWGWAKDTFKTPERFFKKHLILNFCPLSFMEESGRNITPDKLPIKERAPLLAACDKALRRMVEYYRPKYVVGIGGFARKRAEKVLGGMDLQIAEILHPSPASPLANKGWAAQAEKQLKEQGIL